MRLSCLILTLALWSHLSLGQPKLVVAPPTGRVQLSWPYDTNLLSTNLFFHVYETTNVTIPLIQWNTLTNMIGVTTSVVLEVVPGEHYFVVSSSNFWGETSITSQPAYTPPLPIPVNNTVKIEKVP